MEYLNDMQRFYIRNHRDVGLPELASKTGADKKMIAKYLSRLRTQEKAEQKKDRPLPNVTNPVDELMIKNKRRGVVVMTGAASEKGDAEKKLVQKKWAGNVTTIRPE